MVLTSNQSPIYTQRHFLLAPKLRLRHALVLEALLPEKGYGVDRGIESAR